MTTRNQLFPQLVARLNPTLLEAYEERAAVREFDAGMPRPYAECAALLDVLAIDPLALAGVRLTTEGIDRHVLVAADPVRSPQPPLIGEDLHAVVMALGGVALLCRADSP